MEVRRVIQRRLRRKGGGTDLVADVQAVIAANVGDRGSRSHVSAHQRTTTRQGDVESPPEEGATAMTDQERTPDVTPEELEQEGGEQLPDREAIR